MTTVVVTCAPGDGVEKATELMKQNQIRRVIVVDEQRRLQGVVSMADLVERARSQERRDARYPEEGLGAEHVAEQAARALPERGLAPPFDPQGPGHPDGQDGVDREQADPRDGFNVLDLQSAPWPAARRRPRRTRRPGGG